MGTYTRRLASIRHERGAAVMGILNATPDSFYDGGRYDHPAKSIAQVDALLAAGADIIDIGGESSRPGAPRIGTQEQIERVRPALEHAVRRGAWVSIDTTDPAVAEYALSGGATIVNDISCLRDEGLARMVARHDALLVLTHSQRPMQEMAGFSEYPNEAYTDVVEDVRREWRAARDRAEALGVPRESIWFDPGLGFCKNARQSLELLSRLSEFGDAPVVVGASRKSFIGAVDGSPPEQRLGGSIAAALIAIERGASVLRVHDVRETRQALELWQKAPAPGKRHPAPASVHPGGGQGASEANA